MFCLFIFICLGQKKSVGSSPILGEKTRRASDFYLFLLFLFVNIYLADLTSPPHWVSSDIRYTDLPLYPDKNGGGP